MDIHEFLDNNFHFTQFHKTMGTAVVEQPSTMPYILIGIGVLVLVLAMGGRNGSN